MDNKCTTEIWKIKDISDALQKMQHDGKSIVVPRFQRGQRWSAESEKGFIDSLRRHYPVGTLLFYRTAETDTNGKVREVYTLVDGLQRSTAIYRYISNPMKYFSDDDVPESMLADVYGIMGFPMGQEHNLYPTIKKVYVDFIQSLSSFENVQLYPLAVEITRQIPVENKETKIGQLISVFQKYFGKAIADYKKIADTEIPAVVYSGNEEDLPVIFNRINSEGTALTPYEVYAASWPQSDKLIITNDAIIEYILKKYDALEDDIYTVKGYDREEIRLHKKVTYFEYVFGLSKWINNTFSILSFDKKNIKKDEVSTIGFELLDACFHSSKNIGEVYKIVANINTIRLEKTLTDSINIVDSIIAPVIRFKGNKRKDNSMHLFAKNQILSLVAFVFREKYCDDLKTVKQNWVDNESKIRELVFAHFVYDIISVEWDQGSSKLHAALNTKKYYEELSPFAWETNINNMFENELKRRETKNVSPASNADIVFLNCIYMAQFSALQQLSADHFDIEHIATKDLMKKLILSTSSEIGLPISCIANLCYLPEYTNRAKGSNTFYQDNTYLVKSKMSLADIEEKYSFTQEDDLTWANLDYGSGEYDDLRQFYEDFLRNRFKTQKKKFYSTMGIDDSKIDYNRIVESAQEQAKKKSPPTLGANVTYDEMIGTLSAHFGCDFIKQSRTIIVDATRQRGIVLAYSKLYPQGKKHKYWFAFHESKLNECHAAERYYAFACKEDKTILLLSETELQANKSKLNVSNGELGEILYYHIVLFADGPHKVSWLLSKPTMEDRDMSGQSIEFLTKA